MKLVFVILSIVAACVGASTNDEAAKVLARRTLQATKLASLVGDVPQTPRSRQLRILEALSASNTDDDVSNNLPSCDAAFMNCMEVSQCVDCFMELQTRDIDWASVSQATPCQDVISFLNDKGLCRNVEKTSDSMRQFCQTFDACVSWDDDDSNYSDDDGKRTDDGANDKRQDDDTPALDCSELTSCDWEGFHPSFIGNGICNDGIYGCYNSEICGWDGGDCCEDTCEKESNYLECGHDGYFCRDPTSKNCNSWYSMNCNADIVVVDDDSVTDDTFNMDCNSEEASYRLIMYDSFGDGWDATKLSLYENDGDEPFYTGSLRKGSQGTHKLCLSKSPRCYNVKAMGGTWGNEVSWEIKPMMDSPAIAGGGSPMNCYFPVAGYEGRDCPLTCDGKPNLKPSDDPDYKEMKDLFHCIEDKCMIQQGVCDRDEVCKACFNQDEETQSYCYANDAFNVLVDCSLCKCTPKGEDSSYCASKLAPGKTYPSPADQKDKKASSLPDCSPTETLKGGAAVMAFGNCSDIDQVSMMVTDFDENNFGDLDKFETCSHSFASQGRSGSKTALGCMQILVDAKEGKAADDDDTPDLPKQAIAALAKLLYEDAENFCDCAKKASGDCPLCSSFVHFKTLLYETMDACQSLDEIDCDAWKEFYRPCKSNLENEFGKVDFSKNSQCDYVHDGCGGAGPFPSFRRLDCGNELDGDSWGFYNLFAQGCVNGFDPDSDYKPYPEPAPAPAPAPSRSGTVPVPVPSGGKPAPKPYVPPEDRGKPTVPYTPSDDSTDSKSSSESTTRKKRGLFGWFWRLIMWTGLAYGAFYMYKRRADGFSFVQYRRMRNNYGNFDDQDMYSGLALESSTTFEPPSLPPTPMQL